MRIPVPNEVCRRTRPGEVRRAEWGPARTFPGSSILAICLLATMAASAQDSHSSEGTVLRWLNGDELPGELLSATGDRIVWRSDVLARPLSVDPKFLDALRSPKPPGAELPIEPWRVDLTTGDVLFGDLAAVSDDQLRLRSSRFGEAAILKTRIRSLTRLDRADFIDLTKTQGRGWRSVDPKWKMKSDPLADWSADEPGAPSTRSPGTAVLRGRSTRCVRN